MKRPLFHILGSAILALGFLVTVPALAQETVVYPGAMLQHISGRADSLAPSGSGSGKSNSLSGNSVTLNSGTVDEIHGALNLNDTDPATNNHVFIKGGTVKEGVDGGHAMVTSTGNSVTVSGGTVNGGIVGGHAMNWDEANDTVVAENNNVTISGGINNVVYGGYADNNVSGGTAIARNNNVTISGGRVKNDVYGGRAGNSALDGTAIARNNTVTIRGAPTFETGVELNGGFAYATDSLGSASTGNTLNFHSAGLRVHQLYFFQNLNFYLPSTLTAGGTALTVTAAADVADVTVQVSLEGAGPTLQTGNRYVLIDAGTLHGDFQPVSGTVAGYAYTVAKEDNSLVLTIGARQFVPGPTRNYSGQWASVDGEGVPDEYGWGLTVLANFASNNRYIFVPWYTYDSSGNAVWYLFQGPSANYGDWVANDTFTANVYRYTGPAWSTHGEYDDGAVKDGIVGTVKLTFTSATRATFTYTDTEGQSRTVTLGRLEGAPGTGWDYRYTGQWVANPVEKAWGLTVLMTFPTNPDYIFVPWYTYDNSGKAIWYLFQGAHEDTGRWTSNNTFEGEVRRYTGPAWNTHGGYDNGEIDYDVVGTAKLTFTSATAGRFEYSVESSSRTIDLEKLE